jgi:CBS domain-containing protein
MGATTVRSPVDQAEARAFTAAVLADVAAFERMWTEGRFEQGVARMGAEQEMFLVDASGRAQACADGVLASLDAPEFTHELAQFNLEMNCPPQPLDGAMLRTLESTLVGALGSVDAAAAGFGATSVITGILPSLGQTDLTVAKMTQQVRYHGMNDALSAQRGAEFQIFIRGVDTLDTTHANVMLESANTSLQLHLQVDPADFAARYNLIQAITAPLLAAAPNSPLLLGRRLWRETRVALFERAVDARGAGERARGNPTRVGFGASWLEGSPSEIFRADLARHPVMLVTGLEPDPAAELDAGRLPSLRALAVFNGTVWRWNRACFGVADGVAHVRIENRVLPGGPTVLDEVANAALFYGLVASLSAKFPDVRDHMEFATAHQNFLAAARDGLNAQLTWLDGVTRPASELLLQLLPVAAEGLSQIGVPQADQDRYLGVVEGRVRSGQTGAAWQLAAHRALSDMPWGQAGRSLTLAIRRRQKTEKPVHTWPPLDPVEEAVRPDVVADAMSTDLFTVGPEDVVDLASSVMGWKHIRHVPVETRDGHVVGLLTHRQLLAARDSSVPVRTIMEVQPAHVSPDLPLEDALRLMLSTPSGALVVVQDDRLCGILTERDLLRTLAP